MAKNLTPYVEEVANDLSKKLKEAPQVFNWSTNLEPIHRTLLKIKSLKKLPPIIIYQGGSTEFSEKTFTISDKNSILKNFNAFDNEKIISLIITFPWLSKIFYKSIQYYELNAFKENLERKSGPEILDESEITYRLYTYQLRELVEHIKEHRSNIILVTTPLNLEVRPREVCSHSTSNSVVEVQQEIESLINEGRFKEAYPKAKKLEEETFSNALTHFLLGKIALNIGSTSEARVELQKSTAFDCLHWRGNAVFNSIIRMTSEKLQVQLVDFDLYMSANLNRDGLFLDEINPQPPFYKVIEEEISETIKKALSVKK